MANGRKSSLSEDDWLYEDARETAATVPDTLSADGMSEDSTYEKQFGRGIYGASGLLRDGAAAGGTKLVEVFYIDEGTTAWLNAACLAKMDEFFSFHPWQAICVALFKVKPKRSLSCVDGERIWSAEDVEVLRAIMKNYKFVCIEAAPGGGPSDDYRVPVRANVFGLKTLSDEIGTSIVQLFVRERHGKVDHDRALFSGTQQKLYETRVIY
ncbi:unnamed protein product [Gongylonema pulchrum]|uniref:Tudor domain-containing protein n=1 Tax=Gongylonema pulchrum TaxID=637853 RepID=A0A183CUN8_9BILA|nr:unnamed protein product [Gongylonema pulchrum]